MELAYSLLKSVLEGITAPQEGSQQVQSIIDNCSSASKILPIKRTIDSLASEQEMDFCGNLRQVICYYPGNLHLCRKYYDIVKKHAHQFGLETGSINSLSVDIDSYILKNVPDLSSRYFFQNRKHSPRSMGDGVLYKYFGYIQYLSLAQKMLLYVIKRMAPNETLLACLPTGGGKTLSWEYPIVSEHFSGMAIVVVPTIALACDHEKTSKAIFDDPSFQPKAYHGDLSASEKASIIEKIQIGMIPILYISPEALLNNEFKNAVQDAAKENLVSMLVIDEAHLIVQWGVRFRPEFQLLASFRNELEQLTPQGIRTVLLSATLNDADTKIIKKVFHSPLFSEYRADELRPEPEYYLHHCKDRDERRNLLLQLLAQVPRPVILYEAIPEQAKQYYQELQKAGYQRMALFTGETDTAERDRLVSSWRENQIDIMVATSAFGMGVDKADVRTIITGYIPENISRFYQEVGRAGRDGYASLNYWLPFKEEDIPIVHSLTKSSVLTIEKLAARWISMLNKSPCKENSDTVWIDLDTVPDYFETNITGERNRGWNKDVILFLSRLELISIIDTKKNARDDFWLLVHLLNIPVLEKTEQLIDYAESFRDKERERVTDSYGLVEDLLVADENTCFSMIFQEEFPRAERQCSGCPYCRSRKQSGLYSEGEIWAALASYNCFTPTYFTGDDLLSQALRNDRKTIMITSDHMLSDKEICEVTHTLIQKGVNVFIYPEGMNPEQFMIELKHLRLSDYLLLTLSEATKLDSVALINGACAFFFTEDAKYNQKLYKFAQRYINGNENSAVYISDSTLIILSEKKTLLELSNTTISLNQL